MCSSDLVVATVGHRRIPPCHAGARPCRSPPAPPWRFTRSAIRERQSRLPDHVRSTMLSPRQGLCGNRSSQQHSPRISSSTTTIITRRFESGNFSLPLSLSPSLSFSHTHSVYHCQVRRRAMPSKSEDGQFRGGEWLAENHPLLHLFPHGHS